MAATVVSCSSDCSIVISSVNMGDDEPVLLQRLLSHSDYVKKLAHRQGKLFSAGLDGSVNINLLTENAIRPVSSLHTKHSLYSMAVDGIKILTRVNNRFFAYHISPLLFCVLTNRFWKYSRCSRIGTGNTNF